MTARSSRRPAAASATASRSRSSRASAAASPVCERASEPARAQRRPSGPVTSSMISMRPGCGGPRTQPRNRRPGVSPTGALRSPQGHRRQPQRAGRCGDRREGADSVGAAGRRTLEPVSLTIGIVGLPNVGKSTLFNALTKNDVLAANYPFATIEPNVGVVGVPDPRLARARRDLRLGQAAARHRVVRRHRRHRARRVARARGWATSSSPTSARPTRSARSSARSTTPTSSTSTARSPPAATSRRSTPS